MKKKIENGTETSLVLSRGSGNLITVNWFEYSAWKHFRSVKGNRKIVLDEFHIVPRCSRQ